MSEQSRSVGLMLPHEGEIKTLDHAAITMWLDDVLDVTRIGRFRRKVKSEYALWVDDGNDGKVLAVAEEPPAIALPNDLNIRLDDDQLRRLKEILSKQEARP